MDAHQSRQNAAGAVLRPPSAWLPTSGISCRQCPRFSSHIEPYAPWGETMGEVECNECADAVHGSIWVDTSYCRWWSEHVGVAGEQLRMF